MPDGSPLFACQAHFSDDSGLLEISLGANPFVDSSTDSAKFHYNNASQLAAYKALDPRINALLQLLFAGGVLHNAHVSVYKTRDDKELPNNADGIIRLELYVHAKFADIIRVLDPDEQIEGDTFADEVTRRIADGVPYNTAIAGIQALICTLFNKHLE